jgi:hypothetical protein
LLTDTTGMYPLGMSRTPIDARYARVGHLEGDGVGEISATHGGTSERLAALLADSPRKAIGRPREAA